jgi:phytoene dehydrogenase-like protein
MKKENENEIIIIGAGFAGLAAGIYAQKNGYKSRIFEMHSAPGGLCTSWKRKGYTIDGCIHWLVGSSPNSTFHSLWEDVGIAPALDIINAEEYMRYEAADGRTLIFYTDVAKLEKHLLDFSPQDKKPISEFIEGIKICLPFDAARKTDSRLKKLTTSLRVGFNFMVNGKKMQRWMKTSTEEFAGKFKDPVLRDALKEMWVPEFSMFFMLFTFAYLNNKNAGYPLGGSMPMSLAMEKRYRELGGIINYGCRVEKIITQEDSATGIRLTDGTEYTAGRVISAADGYNTIFEMLEGKYVNDKIREPYEKWPVFYPLIYVGLGVSRTFPEESITVSGLSYQLKEPALIGEAVRERLWVHIYNQDPGLAPKGKTSIVIMLPTNYEYWKNLYNNKVLYNEKKEEIGSLILDLLEQRFPGITSLTEVIDVATPITFERYTGNWQGSFEGWLITPQNANTLMKRMSQKLPGLDNFYMCGQWVEPGGGLPTGIMSAQRLLKAICREDRKRFV